MKKNILFFIIVAALIYLSLDKLGVIGSYDVKSPDTTIVRDTVWHESQKTIIKQMVPVETDHSYVPIEPQYQPSQDLDSLLNKFNALVKELTAKNIYRDSVLLDSIGYVVVKDTVQFNKLQKRTYDYKYKIPEINTTTTITKYAAPTRQLYFGGGIGKNNVQGGMLYKNKKDQLFGVYISPPINNLPMQYGVQAYFKIKLKK